MQESLSSQTAATSAAHQPAQAPTQSWLANHEHEAQPTGVKVCVIGAGFVGLVTAAGLTQIGHTVTCVDKDLRKVEELSSGRVRLYERGLSQLVSANLQRGRLSFELDLQESVRDQHFIIIAVGTPTDGNGNCDMTSFNEVLSAIAGVVNENQVVVIKSTVPVGTARRAARQLCQGNGTEGSVPVISSPEFLRESTAVYDFFHPERIVVGGRDPVAVDRVVQLFRVGLAHPAPIVATANETAELIKYASNAYLAMRLSFVNELSTVCDAMQVEVGDVTCAMGLDRRIGSEYFDVGPGYGGSCLPKDLDAYVEMARRHGRELVLAPAIREVNRVQLDNVVEKIRAIAGGNLKGRRIGALGLAFKAQTHDMRASPAVRVIQRLLLEGAAVSAYDPAAMPFAEPYVSDATLCDTAESVADEADVIVILTEWPDFQVIDWGSVRGRVKQPNIVDARNLLNPQTMRRHGFQYVGMGQQ